MEKIFAQYFIREGNKRVYLTPGKMIVRQTEPRMGEQVVVNGTKYEITSADYDYELWQAFKDKIYDVAVRKI